jgi:site-specific DNA-methyltransferase (adenine-specific)
MDIYNDDCFNILNDKTFIDTYKNKINLVLVDLPYGQTACHWDIKINLSKMWKSLDKTCKRNCIYVFFCTTKFGFDLIQSRKTWFRYDMVWKKPRAAGFMSCNKIPMRSHEMIYVFSTPPNSDDLECKYNLELRAYFKNMTEDYICKSKAEIHKRMGGCVSRALRYNSTQFSKPSKRTYDKLIKEYGIDKMENYIKYEDLPAMNYPKYPQKTYNPQMSKGKPYICKQGSGEKGIYGYKSRVETTNSTGDRYPTSVLFYNNPKKPIHNTQKPVDLCEYLIKTYTNENDTVLDFTMGSGSTGVACKNTNRKFIGIELDKNIFEKAKKRLYT